MKKLFAIMVLSASAAAASAQVGVYALAGAGKVSSFPPTLTAPPPGLQNPNGWSYGGTFGVYDNFLSLGPLKLGADARGFKQSSSGTITTYGNQIRGGLAGLRLAFHLLTLKPYIQAELGAVNANYTAFGQASIRSTSGAYQVQVGADFTIFPHLDIRAEYGDGQLFDRTTIGTVSNRPRLQQTSAGAVLRF